MVVGMCVNCLTCRDNATVRRKYLSFFTTHQNSGGYPLLLVRLAPRAYSPRMWRRNFMPRRLVVGAMCIGVFSLPVRAQLPPRLERCLPYPTLADEIRDMTATGAEETVKAKATVDDVRIEGATYLPSHVQRQLTISIFETDFVGESANWLGALEYVGINGLLRNHGS